MLNVFVISYAHIDFWVSPSESAESLVEQGLLPCTEEQAAEAFRRAGWEGDGHIHYIWIPPFMFNDDTYGLCVWHVKQDNNGTSWLCSEMAFESPGLDDDWRTIELDAPPRNRAMPF